MEEPQSNTLKSSPRKRARGYTVIPFPIQNTSRLKDMLVEHKESGKPNFISHTPFLKIKIKGKKLLKRKTQLNQLNKTCTNACQYVGKTFQKAKKDTEVELLEIFNFLGEVDMPAKIDLLKKFNEQISSGIIQSSQQMHEFLEKAQQLADCIKLYLQKNEYSELFMKEISYDVFEKGFSAQNHASIKRKYPKYFK